MKRGRRGNGRGEGVKKGGKEIREGGGKERGKTLGRAPNSEFAIFSPIEPVELGKGTCPPGSAVTIQR